MGISPKPLRTLLHPAAPPCARRRPLLEPLLGRDSKAAGEAAAKPWSLNITRLLRGSGGGGTSSGGGANKATAAKSGSAGAGAGGGGGGAAAEEGLLLQRIRALQVGGAGWEATGSVP
jgi:hypothetical protein